MERPDSNQPDDVLVFEISKKINLRDQHLFLGFGHASIFHLFPYEYLKNIVLKVGQWSRIQAQNHDLCVIGTRAIGFNAEGWMLTELHFTFPSRLLFTFLHVP